MAAVQDVYARRNPSAGPPRSREVAWWFFMRVSGVLLLFLVLGHLAVMHVFGGGVDRINFDFVAARWAGWFWRTYDLALLWLSLLHGAVGARNVALDYVRRASRRRAVNGALFFVTGIFLILGSWVILTFDASQMPGG